MTLQDGLWMRLSLKSPYNIRMVEMTLQPFKFQISKANYSISSQSQGLPTTRGIVYTLSFLKEQNPRLFQEETILMPLETTYWVGNLFMRFQLGDA